MDKLKEIQEKILEWWNKFTSKQKTVIIGIGAVVIFTFAILIYIFSRPQYILLTTCSTTSDASTVTGILDSAGVTYTVSNDGLQISVVTSQESAANLALGAAGFLPDDPDLDSVFSGGFSTTESDKQKRYVAYLEQQMEKNFETYNSVKSAKVQLNIPNQDGTLIAKTEEAYAYIRLELNGTFTPDNAATMAKAAAARLGNKTTANIVIVDTDANLLFSGDSDYSAAGQASTFMELNNQAEAFIKAKVKQALLGTGQFDMVEVAPYLNLDFSSYEQTDHNYNAQDGNDQGYYSHQYIEETENSSGSGGVPGTDSNNETTYMYQDSSNTSSSSSIRDTDYLLDESILKTVTPAGVIDYPNSSITITALSYNIVREETVRSQGLLDGITWEQYKLDNETSIKLEVDEDFYSAVATATGMDADSITIVAFRENLFYDRETSEINWTDILSIVMILIILALLAFVIFRSMYTKREVEPEEELSVEKLLQSTPEPDVEDIELETKSETRKMIEKFVDDNPEAAANLLRNWLNEDWG